MWDNPCGRLDLEPSAQIMIILGRWMFGYTRDNEMTTLSTNAIFGYRMAASHVDTSLGRT